MTEEHPVELDGPNRGADANVSLGRAAAGGVAWQGLSYLSGKVLVLVSTAILARILTPQDFGMVALALVFITYAEVVTDLGVAQALVFLPPDTRRNDAALTLCLLTSGALVGIAMLAAPGVAAFFGEPDVTPMFRVLSLSLVLAATSQVPDALIRKDLRFRNRLIIDLCRAFGQGIVSIALAIAGAGAWAIVAGYLAGNLIRSIAAWALVDYKPALGRFWRLDREAVKPLITYGAPAAGNALLLSLVFNIDYLIVGRALGQTALGFYTLAFRLPQIAILNVFYVLSSVAFPLFSRARDDTSRLRRGYLTSVRLQTVYGVGAGVTLAVVAPLLIEVIFGAQWRPSVVPLQALSLYAAFRSLGIGAVDVYNGIGRPGLAVSLSLVRFALLVPALIVATRWGIEGISWTQAAVALVLAVMMQAVAARVLQLSPRAVITAVLPALAVGLAAGVGAGVVGKWLPGPDPVRLVAALTVGAGAGLAALWAADRRLIEEMKALLARRSIPSTVTTST